MLHNFFANPEASAAFVTTAAVGSAIIAGLIVWAVIDDILRHR